MIFRIAPKLKDKQGNNYKLSITN